MEIQPNNPSRLRFQALPDGRESVKVDGEEKVLYEKTGEDTWEEYKGGRVGTLGLWYDAPTTKRVPRGGILGWFGFKKTVEEAPNGKVEPSEIRTLTYGETDFPDRTHLPLPSEIQPKGWVANHYVHRFKFDKNARLEETSSTIRGTANETLAQVKVDLGVIPTNLYITESDKLLPFTYSERLLKIEKKLERGEHFEIGVNYEGQPEVSLHPAVPTDLGWLESDNSVVTMNGLDFGSSWMPVDNDPSNKATYDFEVETPDNLFAVANGELVKTEKTESGTRHYFRSEKMSPCVASVNVFDKDKYTTTKVGKDLEVIHPKGAEARVKDSFANHDEMMKFLEAKIGDYPFATYGAIVASLPVDEEIFNLNLNGTKFAKHQKLPIAFEAQTRSIFEESGIHGEQAEETIFHELTHQWFGNSVTKKAPKDIWVAEGMGRYAPNLWAEHRHDADLDARLKQLHTQLKNHTFTDTMANPDRNKLISQENYSRMELSMHALRKEVGDDQFFASLRHVTETYKDKSISSEQMAEAINQFNGGRLTEFFDAWLHGTELPDIKFDNH